MVDTTASFANPWSAFPKVIPVHIRTTNIVDKSQWPRGPWDDEPDKAQWIDAESQLPCLAVRNSDTGNWCGYVGIASGHPLYNNPYQEVDLNVHGGLTYSGTGSGSIHFEGLDGLWLFGFDCAHSQDLSPGMRIHNGSIYRTLDYVRIQCAELARQLQSTYSGMVIATAKLLGYSIHCDDVWFNEIKSPSGEHITYTSLRHLGDSEVLRQHMEQNYGVIITRGVTHGEITKVDM